MAQPLIRAERHCEGKVGHPLEYYRERRIVLDCRGDLRISPTARIARDVAIITAGHPPWPESFREQRLYPVHIRDEAFIGHGALLFDCVVGERAIVRPGSVVCSRIVEAYTIVEGNPAMCVAKWNGEKWKRLWVAEPLRTMGRRK